MNWCRFHPALAWVAIGAVGCGHPNDSPVATTATDVREPVATPTPKPPEPPAGPRKDPPEREVISEELEARLRRESIRARETPIRVGSKAPVFEGFLEKRKSVIVFFRGAW